MQLPCVDPDVPSPARVWNYWLGGTDNFPVDRELAERVMVAMPSMPLIARFARLFLADAVGRLSELGIRQFLDIGSGVPTADNTHQVAQRLAPESRIVYADRDPTVARHARSLLSSLPSGSYLVIGHAASDLAPEAAAEMTRRNNQTSPVPITPRTRAQVTRFFDGLDLMPPGVVPISEWDLDGAMDTAVGDLVGYAGIGRKP